MELADYPTELNQAETWRDDEPAEAYGKFEEVLSSAEAQGIISDLPASVEESGADPNQPDAMIDYQVRAQVISERLWLLGYIKLEDKDDARNLFQDNRAEFLAAVGKFQLEAGLVKDGWVGKKTWTLLSNLVNFELQPMQTGSANEESQDLELWNAPLGAGLNNRAVMRAAALRLHVLGLAKQPPGKGSPYRRPDKDAVRDFHRILWSLGLVKQLYAGQLTKITLPLLMEHDGIIKRVASYEQGGNDEFKLNSPDDWPEEAFKDKTQLFLTRLVQIELWLLGFEVGMSVWRRYSVHGIRQRPVFDPSDDFNTIDSEFYDPDEKLELLLRDYYQTFRGLNKEASEASAEEIRPSLFNSFLNPQHEQINHSDEATESDAYDEVLGNIHTNAEAEEQLKIGRSLGLRIWDGLKRIWRWFKRKIVDVVNFAKNLARAFYRYVSKGFSIVKRAIRAVVKSVQRYVAGEFNFDGVHVFLYKDFDTRVLVPKEQSLSTITLAGTRLKLFSSRFLFACRVIGLIFDAFTLSAMQRWARLAMTLASKLKQLIPLYREIVDFEKQLPADLR